MSLVTKVWHLIFFDYVLQQKHICFRGKKAKVIDWSPPVPDITSEITDHQCNGKVLKSDNFLEKKKTKGLVCHIIMKSLPVGGGGLHKQSPKDQIP